MRKKQKTPKPPVLSSKIRGKTFVLVCSDSSFLDESARLLALLCGEVVCEIAPGLDYLAVLDYRTGQPTREEAQADALNEGGAAIEVLNRQSFLELLSPTREEALVLLKSGDEGLEQWRQRRNSASQTLIDLSGVDLRGAKLTDIVLERVKLDGADLSGADLSYSRLETLTRVNLDGAILHLRSIAHLTDCSARNADLSHARLDSAVIVRTDFTSANLKHASGSGIRSEQAVFRNVDLTYATFEESSFLQADFSGAKLTQATLEKCDLTGADFRGAVLSEADLRRANLTNADLTGAKLDGANLGGVDLTGATVERANFEGAYLHAANLSAVGPGRPRKLVPPPAAAAVESIGPNMRQLADLRNGLEISIHIDPDRRAFASRFVRLCIDDSGRSLRAGSWHWKFANGRRLCQTDTFLGAMLELAQQWPGAELYSETLSVRRSGGRAASKELSEVVLAAWHEAFGVPLPSPAERKALRQAARERFLNLLRGGPEGVDQWNSLAAEVLTRAGHFRRANLENLDLRGARLSRGTQFGGVDFEGANFDGVNLSGGCLDDCSLIRTTFRKAILDGVGFSGANLRQADFEQGSLVGCNLSKSCCEGANFQNANLRNADLRQADLCGADLTAADLEGARFRQTKHNAATRFPQGFVFPVRQGKGQPPPPGSRVEVTDGAFTGMEGEVKEILEDKGLVQIELTIFGRPVPIELEYDDVEKI